MLLGDGGSARIAASARGGYTIRPVLDWLGRARRDAARHAMPSHSSPMLSRTLGAPTPMELSRTRVDLERFRAGDQSAFETIWNRYRPVLLLLVVRSIRQIGDPALRSKLDAEDLVQDSMAVVCAKLKDFQYRGPGSLCGWMKTIAGNCVRDKLDYWQAGKRAHAEGSIDEQGHWNGAEPILRSREPGPATSVERDESRARVANAMAALPERGHTIILLWYFFGATWDEIASEVGAPSADAVRKEHDNKLLPELGRLLGAS